MLKTAYASLASVLPALFASGLATGTGFVSGSFARAKSGVSSVLGVVLGITPKGASWKWHGARLLFESGVFLAWLVLLALVVLHPSAFVVPFVVFQLVNASRFIYIVSRLVRGGVDFIRPLVPHLASTLQPLATVSAAPKPSGPTLGEVIAFDFGKQTANRPAGVERARPERNLSTSYPW
ncbi:hypothetical protein EON83_00130 [bacterium]|nr:MAG: hypothetical protein EON83_00130 [bacterium]